MVMDDTVRQMLRPWLQSLARAAGSAGLRPGHLTALGLALAAAAAVAAALGAWWWAAGLWLVSRVPDGVDGVLARQQGTASDLGGFHDIMADFAGYGGFVLGVAVGLPDARIACAALLLAYYLNGSAFLAISGLAEKRRTRVVEGNGEERSLQFVTGLTEGTETVLAHTAFAVLAATRTGWVPAAVWVFAAMVGVTIVQRVLVAHRVLRD